MIRKKTLENGFEYLEIQNSMAEAKIALQGAHVFAYKALDKPALLWCSQKAHFEKGKAIRGGIPICFPWFGKHEDDSSFPQHGFARTSLWKLVYTEELEDGSSHVRLKICESSQSLVLWDHKFELTLDVYVEESLRMVLHMKNTDTKAFEVSTAFHTYFQVSDIKDVSIEGLDNAKYYDALTQSTHTQLGILTIDEETDRVYQTYNEKLRFNHTGLSTSIESKGSSSVVIWNPWKKKSKAMVDMTDEGYKSMVCLETSNAREDTKYLKPAEEHSLEVIYKQNNL